MKLRHKLTSVLTSVQGFQFGIRNLGFGIRARIPNSEFLIPNSSRLDGPMPQKEHTYDEAQIAERLRDLPGWYYQDGWIRRVYKTDGWPTTLMLVNAIGFCAEAAYHH